jgi:hypothetical protein
MTIADQLSQALRDLLDEQNGPPLVRREGEWQAASDAAIAALAAYDAAPRWKDGIDIEVPTLFLRQLADALAQKAPQPRTAEPAAEPAHDDHGRHWSRTCPACNASADYTEPAPAPADEPPPFELPPPDVRFGAALDSLARYSGAAVRQCITERDGYWIAKLQAERGKP